MVKCQKCGTENPNNAVFCQECGFRLGKVTKKNFFKSLDYKALLIGSLISIILFITLIQVGLGYLGLIGSVVSGFIARGSFKRGAVHGGFMLFILSLSIGFSMSILLSSFLATNWGGSILTGASFIFLTILFTLVCLIFSVIGGILGVIGVWISKKLNKDPNEPIRDNTELSPNEETETIREWWARKSPNQKWKIGYISLIVIIWSIPIILGLLLGSHLGSLTN